MSRHKVPAWSKTIDDLRTKLQDVETANAIQHAAIVILEQNLTETRADVVQRTATLTKSTQQAKSWEILARSSNDRSDCLHDYLIGINNALSKDQGCNGHGEIRDQEWRIARIDVLKTKITQLTERIHEDNAVCLCGCAASEHEQYDEDGESCENETHVCLRVPKAVAAEFAALQAEIKRLTGENDLLRTAFPEWVRELERAHKDLRASVREGKREAARWMAEWIDQNTGGVYCRPEGFEQAIAELDRRYPRETEEPTP